MVTKTPRVVFLIALSALIGFFEREVNCPPAAGTSANQSTQKIDVSGVANAGAPVPQGTTAPAATRSDLAEIRQKSLSHATISMRTGPVEIYLYARDQKASIVASPYCAANEGDHEFEGHYQLVSARGETMVSRLAVLPGGTFFVADRPPHDGIHLFQANGHPLAVLYRYAGCNTEIFHAYKVDQAGKLGPVDFLARDGRRFSSEATGPGGEVKTLPDGRDVFCWYNNGIARSLCDVYRFDGRNFTQVDAWISWQGGSDNIDQVIPKQRAARTLYDFLAALDNKKYQAAAFYYASAGGSAAKSRTQAAADLKKLLPVTRSAMLDSIRHFSRQSARRRRNHGL